jgi:hypothetical protein
VITVANSPIAKNVPFALGLPKANVGAVVVIVSCVVVEELVPAVNGMLLGLNEQAVPVGSPEQFSVSVELLAG